MLAFMDEGVTAASITAVQGISTDVSPLLPALEAAHGQGLESPDGKCETAAGVRSRRADWTIFKRRV